MKIIKNFKANNKILNFIKYSGIVYVAQLLNILYIFLLPKFLEPTMMGEFNIIQVIYSYLTFSNLGIWYGLDKEIPALIQKQDTAEVTRKLNNGVSSSIAISLIIEAALILFSIFFYSKYGDICLGVLISTVAIVFYQFVGILKIIARAGEQVNQMSSLALMYGLVWTGCRIIGVILYGFWGLLFGMLAANIIATFASSQITKIKINFEFDLKEIKHLFKTGFPFFLCVFLTVLFFSLDKWALSMSLGFEEVGYYAIGSMVLGFLIMLPTSINELLFPGLLKKISLEVDKKIISDYLKRFVLISSKLFAIIIAGLIVVIPFIVNGFFPKYQPGILSAQVLLIACYPFIFQNLFSYYLFGIKRTKLIIFVLVFSIIFFIVSAFALKMLNMINLVSVAMLMAISSFLQSYLIIYFSFLELKFSAKEMVLYLAKSLVPLYIIGLAFLIPFLLKFNQTNLFKSLLLVLIYEILLALLALPLLKSVWLVLSGKKQIK